QPVQFLIDQRHQIIKRRLISVAPGDEHLCHFILRGCHRRPSSVERVRLLAKASRIIHLHTIFHPICLPAAKRSSQFGKKILNPVRGFVGSSRITEWRGANGAGKSTKGGSYEKAKKYRPIHFQSNPGSALFNERTRYAGLFQKSAPS